jgi:hypothetical protein
MVALGFGSAEICLDRAQGRRRPLAVASRNLDPNSQSDRRGVFSLQETPTHETGAAPGSVACAVHDRSDNDVGHHCVFPDMAGSVATVIFGARVHRIGLFG